MIVERWMPARVGELMATRCLAMTIGLYLFSPVYILAISYDCATWTIAFPCI